MQYDTDPTTNKLVKYGPDNNKKMSGEEYYKQERERMGNEKFYDSEQEKFAKTNFRLNNAYDNGKRNAMGKIKSGTKNSGGEDITGTGRNNYWVKGRK